MKTLKTKVLRALGVRATSPSQSKRYLWIMYNNI